MPCHLAPGARATAEDRPRAGRRRREGCCHVGVLKVLEELRIPVDSIAGTSMGAIVGGMYASGMSPAEIEQFLISTDWNELFTDDTQRQDVGFRRKSEDYENLAKISLGYRDGHFSFRKGVLRGREDRPPLRDAAPAGFGHQGFRSPACAFRAISADLETGEMVVLGSGSSPRRYGASMSLPGIFPPW